MIVMYNDFLFNLIILFKKKAFEFTKCCTKTVKSKQQNISKRRINFFN